MLQQVELCMQRTIPLLENKKKPVLYTFEKQPTLSQESVHATLNKHNIIQKSQFCQQQFAEEISSRKLNHEQSIF